MTAAVPAWALAVLTLLPLGGALMLALRPRASRAFAAGVAGAVALVALALVAALAADAHSGHVLQWSVDWLPALGLSLGFRLDGLAWLFALLIAGIGALVVLYAAWYLGEEDPAPRFFAALLLFMGAMLGVVMAADLVLLVVYWELTSLSSFLLIGYWRHREDAREGATMALTITGAGGLCLLGGVLLLGHIVGSTQLDAVLAAGPRVVEHPLYETVLVLVLLGCFTKSAQVPFHFWLPHAMAAPTPVSAYLHSATMVKAGVFLLARLYPALGGGEAWFWLVTLTGAATLLVGAWVAVSQHDLKGLLAWSTISHLGLITLLFGLGSPLAVVAGVFHIINHATFKASLFMAAGIVDHETGTRDLRRLGGLARYLPITATLATVAAAAMAGVPLLNGFLSKEMFFAEALAADTSAVMRVVLPVVATLGGAFSVAYSLRLVHESFFDGPPRALPRPASGLHEPPRAMRLPVELLVLLCLGVGLFPALIVGPTLAAAAQAAVFGGPAGALPAYHLAVWHGLNAPLAMSALALAGGTGLYLLLRRRWGQRALHGIPGRHPKHNARDHFRHLLAAATALAGRITASLGRGSLQRYLLWFIATALAAGLWPLWRQPITLPPLHLGGLDTPVAIVALIGVAATLATTVLHRQRLTALVLIGATGLAVCLAFVHLSAPDLALTQLLVEMVSIVLMMLALRWLPERSLDPGDSFAPRLRDALLCAAAGLGVAALVWTVQGLPFDSLSPHYLDHALSEGGGANVVNVIIVDFRGFDTLGEITVLAMAALVIHALLRDYHPAPRHDDDGPPRSLMLGVVARLVLPFTALVSLYLLLRGHNLPGGGFIAGLVLAIGLILQSVASGHAWAELRTGIDFRAWIGWGLLVAGGTGVASWFFGAPFLTSTYDYPWLPGIGGVPLASAAVFDGGVYLVVVGATLVALGALARLSDTDPSSRPTN
ncbi:MAG: monovalent cation/H+ antiporter subunit A [Pseudomonadota bacterium]